MLKSIVMMMMISEVQDEVETIGPKGGVWHLPNHMLINSAFVCNANSRQLGRGAGRLIKCENNCYILGHYLKKKTEGVEW